MRTSCATTAIGPTGSDWSPWLRERAPKRNHSSVSVTLNAFTSENTQSLYAAGAWRFREKLVDFHDITRVKSRGAARAENTKRFSNRTALSADVHNSLASCVCVCVPYVFVSARRDAIWRKNQKQKLIDETKWTPWRSCEKSRTLWSSGSQIIRKRHTISDFSKAALCMVFSNFKHVWWKRNARILEHRFSIKRTREMVWWRGTKQHGLQEKRGKLSVSTYRWKPISECI